MIGPGSLEGQDFPLSEIDPAAIDKIVSGVKQQAGVNDLKVTVMTLEKSTVDGQLKWTINAEGGGRTGLVYNAEPDGSNVTSPLGDIAGRLERDLHQRRRSTGDGPAARRRPRSPSASSRPGPTSRRSRPARSSEPVLRHLLGDPGSMGSCASWS